MLTLVILTLFLVLVLVGWGRLCIFAVNRLGVGAAKDYSILDAAVLGMFAVTAAALLLNFFIAISTEVTYAFIAGGVAMCLGTIRNAWETAVTHRRTIFALIGFATLYSVRFIEAGPSFDAGLYHIPYLNWVSAGPVPFGLANLEGRLGFNSSWLMFDAAFRMPYLGWSYLKVTESAVWTLASCVVFERLMRGLKTLSAQELPTLVALSLVFGIFAWRIDFSGVSSTDEAPNLFALLAAVYFVECMAAFRAVNDARAFASVLLHLCCAVLAITGKLSTAPIALLSVYCLIFAIRQKDGGARYVLVVIPAVFIGEWLVRSLILSGCIVYPVPFTCLDTLSWTMRDSTSVVKVIVAWARKPGPEHLEALDGLDWVRPWAFRMRYESIPRLTVLILGATVFLAGCGVYMMLWGRKFKALGWAVYLNLANAYGLLGALGLLLWSLSAPDPRFSWLFFVLLTIPSTAACVQLFEATTVLQRASSLLTSRHVGAILIVFLTPLLVFYQVQFPSLRATMGIPVPAVFETRLEMSAVTVRRPIYRNQCWDTYIPCTPDLAKDLLVDHWMGRLRFRASKSVGAPIGPE